jgi:hypothetical protein
MNLLRRHAGVHDPACMTVRAGTNCFVSPAQFGTKRVRHARCIGRLSQVHTYGLEIMGTEIVIVAVTVAFFGLCALFVRICDRI